MSHITPDSQIYASERELLGYDGDQSFRDSIGTLDAQGQRRWVYAKQVRGWYTRWRTAFALLLLAILLAGPFVEINGHPLLLLNVLERKFVVLGQVFWPQDFILFGLAFLVTVLFVGVFTLAYGRLFCGWACPQTIFMEHVFRRIEYWIEGDAAQQRALDREPWTPKKIWKKCLKHGIFFAISFIIGNVFLAYIIGKDALFAIITDPPAQHLAGLSGMVAFSGVFYLVFAHLREQVCLIACPYGRLQGVLLDNNSVVVAYDYVRGEPRGKMLKHKPRTDLGDCVNCYACVQVCPTAIDIRNGTQLECINCTACMDACDEIMDRIDRPRGLISYASRNNIAQKQRFRFTGRLLFLSAVMVLLAVVLGYLTFSRVDVQVTMLRLPGTLYQTQDDGNITNIYRMQLVNKTFDEKDIQLTLLKPAGATLSLNTPGTHIVVAGQQMREVLVVITCTPAQLQGIKTQVQVAVQAGDETIDKLQSAFMGPAK